MVLVTSTQVSMYAEVLKRLDISTLLQIHGMYVE